MKHIRHPEPKQQWNPPRTFSGKPFPNQQTNSDTGMVRGHFDRAPNAPINNSAEVPKPQMNY